LRLLLFLLSTVIAILFGDEQYDIICDPVCIFHLDRIFSSRQEMKMLL
jgi:hypothetical protein